MTGGDARDAVDEALAAYAEAHRADPGADPVPYLEMVSADQRPLLAELLDAYLTHAPRADFDRAAFEGSWMEAAVERWQSAREPAVEPAAAETWKTLLPSLRERAKLTRERVVSDLAAALGLSGREEKVGGYYHEMEQGLLDPRGVSDRVLDALGAIFSESSERLRAAGLPSPPASPGTVSLFARTAFPDERYASDDAADGGDEVVEELAIADAEWDEVDELFRGDAPDSGEARPPE